ncbi:cupin domain-containing protein [Phytoactinopolyspora mesophila]|uniref:Cupin domain-containing protein n=1 Tax=Phytoactinopolyspora mesophila TaxID=2650750 RepID=A0A7K3MA02_9ACTN|nr:cupin domain-containing protein [Phytoactinopolyspora mesophila]NDL59792.1 cupin domain-containing protein [Phytoactinopolyspora mesophila]
MTATTLNIDDALATFDELWSPRILTHVNDWDVRLAKVKGEYVWHAHADTDELFIVLDGVLDIYLRGADGSERSVRLGRHDVFVVPKGTEHRPVSENGATMMLFEPSGTLTTGDYAGDVPEHIISTTGTPMI